MGVIMNICKTVGRLERCAEAGEKVVILCRMNKLSVRRTFYPRVVCAGAGSAKASRSSIWAGSGSALSSVRTKYTIHGTVLPSAHLHRDFVGNLSHVSRPPCLTHPPAAPR